MFSINTSYLKKTFYILLTIHLFTPYAKTTALSIFDLHPNAENSTIVNTTPSPQPGTITLHFSHKKSPVIREMGYCQLSIDDTNTGEIHNFPPLNIHTNSSKKSRWEMLKEKREKRERREKREKREKKILTEVKQQQKSRPLPKPQTSSQTYEKDYEIPINLLEPGNYLCISFFIDSLYISRYRRVCAMIAWQNLKDIPLLELSSLLDNKSNQRLTSIELSIDWNRELTPLHFEDFETDSASLKELESAARLVPYYKKIPA